MEGVSASEYFFHSMSAREGLIDTGMKTATTGYIQRKIIKVAENVHLDHHRNVRGSQDIILNTVYGVDGMKPIFIG
jgi:DNA-directed RNA polymerase beta' subunit